MLKKIDHIGIAVHSIEEARPFYEKTLGLAFEGEENVTEQHVKTAFFAIGETQIELLEPTSPESPLHKFLETRGEGIHHIAYRSDNLEENLEAARQNGCNLINEKPITGAGGKQIAFLHPKSTFGVLTELCEHTK